jgi:uncharacterized membrane protein
MFFGVMGVLAFFFPFSLVVMGGSLLPPGFGVVSSVMILLGGAATLLADIRRSGRARAMVRLALLCVGLFGIEQLGVRSGLPFGEYAYTQRLGLLVAGVPVAIGVAWYSTVVNAWRIVRKPAGSYERGGSPIIALGTGVIALGLDIALEPTAGFVEKYWIWSPGVVPLQNYLSWFLLAAAAALLLERSERSVVARGESDPFPASAALLASQALIFLVTSALNGYVRDALLSLFLMALPALVLRPADPVVQTSPGVGQ